MFHGFGVGDGAGAVEVGGEWERPPVWWAMPPGWESPPGVRQARWRARVLCGWMERCRMAG